MDSNKGDDMNFDSNEYWNRGYVAYLQGYRRYCNHNHTDMDQFWLRGYDTAKGQAHAEEDEG